MATKTLTNKQKGEQRRANQLAAGIPESRRFIAPEGERLPCGEDRLLECHIGGIKIRDMNLDPQVLACLDYRGTEEGIAERNAQPQMREASGVRLGADEWNKALSERRDDVKDRDMPLYESRDPLLEVAKKYRVPGMAEKFLSENRIKENSSTGDYQVVKDAVADPVKVRGMVLGHMPVEKRNARNAHYRNRGNQMLQQIDQQFQAEVPAGIVDDQK